MKTIRVGTRDSRLAIVQAELVMAAARRFHPDLEFELVAMKTAGDRILDRPLDALGGKGLFVKELDAALRGGDVDICVHSHKDLPLPDNPDLPVVAVPRREDPRDVLILPRDGRERRDRPLGTSSSRRRLQLAALYRGWACESVRGNVVTRLAKLDGGRFGGLVLAAAGLRRLGLWERASVPFAVADMLPAACQGILAVQGRAGGDYGYLAELEDPDSRAASVAERAFVQTLGGDCSSPLAAYAGVSDGRLRLSGMYVGADGSMLRGELSGRGDDARSIGMELAERLKREGTHGGA